MKDMLSRSALQENRRLLNQVEDLLIGPERDIWKSALHRFLRRDEPVFLKTESFDPFRKERQFWQKFYKSVFEIEENFSNVHIPERPGSMRDWWLIIIPKGMSPRRLYSKCKEQFSCWCWTDKDLNEIVESERTAKNGHYAVWVKARVEADEEFKNLSANDLKRRDHKGITLEERLALELSHFWKTQKHLDIQNVTLCAGSRYSGGYVPSVCWGGAGLGVDWCGPGGAHGDLRSREAVS